jgi:hypothetical protein
MHSYLKDLAFACIGLGAVFCIPALLTPARGRDREQPARRDSRHGRSHSGQAPLRLRAEGWPDLRTCLTVMAIGASLLADQSAGNRVRLLLSIPVFAVLLWNLLSWLGSRRRRRSGDQQPARGARYAGDPGYAADPQYAPDSRREPAGRRQSDPRYESDPRHGADPRRQPDPRRSVDPRRADPRYESDPRRRPDSRYQADPRYESDPGRRPESRYQADPRHEADPRHHADSRRQPDPRLADPRQADPRQADPPRADSRYEADGRRR